MEKKENEDSRRKDVIKRKTKGEKERKIRKTKRKIKNYKRKKEIKK